MQHHKLPILDNFVKRSDESNLPIISETFAYHSSAEDNAKYGGKECK